MTYEEIAERIRRYEGLCYTPYQCPAGEWTIGYGHLLRRGISKEVAEAILKEDVYIAVRQVKNLFVWWFKLVPARQYVLVDMCFNLGISRLCGFKKMLAAAERGDYARAAAEMLYSKWAGQVGRRARELSEMMKTGEWLDDGNY